MALARVVRFALDHSLLLVIGAFAALVWANVDPHGYERATHYLHFAANDIGMVFFFALAAKEVFEATLPGGALASFRLAAAPLAAAVGGMVVPAGLFVTFVALWGPSELMRGWAIPCATDIAFSAMVARLVFPSEHPAIPFLLLLAIADDALGLMILALFYPSAPLSPITLIVLMSAAVTGAAVLRHRRVQSFWPYILGPGALSWAALYFGGVHPALALVPIVPLMPHAASDRGLFAHEEGHTSDTLTQFEHWWATPVQCVLLLFGFANAGVLVTEIGPGAYYVLGALVLGKPLGILLFSGMVRVAGARLPPGLTWPALVVVGLAASIGFTVSLFFATAAFPVGEQLAQTKMGALLSFAAAPLALMAALLVRSTRGRL